MQGDGGEDGQQVGEAGRDISSTPSGDVEMLEEQDQELVVGTGTHLGGVVAKARAKVKYTNVSEKVTVDVLSRRIQVRLWVRESRERHQPGLTLL